MIHRQNVAGILINNEGKVLLAQRSLGKKVAPGKWHIPGGKVEEGEDIITGIEREFEEELALTVTRVVPTGFTHQYPVGDEMHETVFVAVEATGEVKINFESEAFAWVAPNAIAPYFADEPELIPVNEKAIALAQEVLK